MDRGKWIRSEAILARSRAAWTLSSIDDPPRIRKRWPRFTATSRSSNASGGAERGSLGHAGHSSGRVRKDSAFYR